MHHPLPPVPSPVEGEPLVAPFPPMQKFRDRYWLHLLLFLLTIATTTLAGANHYAGYVTDFGRQPIAMTVSSLRLSGFWYSGTILLILGAHELGHYLACRYYQVDASLPFFIPAPLITGTMGAFIKIREPIPSKRMLFDIGIAGPIAGFIFAVPTLFFGVAMSPVVSIPPNFRGHELGEPLLFQMATWVIWGSIPDGFSVNLHPMAFAAWFGLLATALNLFPIGQLDGGHISYAVLGRRSTGVTIAAIGVAVTLTFVSTSWIVWTLLLVAMTLAMGPHHPRTLDEDVPLDRTRLWLAGFALLMLVLCFTYNPISPIDLLQSRR